MNPKDFSKFANAWADAHEVMAAGKILSQGAMQMCFDALAQYPLDSVLIALEKHCQLSRFAPTPYDICQLLEIHNRRLSAAEAWAECPQSEDDTVVWTEEAAAAYAVAVDFVHEGRHYEANQAFKAAYERLCSESALRGKPIKWVVSLGHEKEGIKPVLERAVLAGRLTQENACRLIPAPNNGGIIGGLLTGKINVSDLPNNDAVLKERWGQISGALKRDAELAEQRRLWLIEENEEKRAAFEQKKQGAIDKLEAHLKNKPQK